jgi:7,8-dihydropterin-6-yl-methyl-4-(beta-D-ribofuranosyl)aminobenzene 5'-phosphate synthase
MNNKENFGEINTASVTVLVDNRADMLVESSQSVKRYQDKPLLSEHGFSALIDINEGEMKVLWDAGMTRIALMENLQCMEIDLKSIDKIALSHGHGDHTAAMTDVIQTIVKQHISRTWEPSITNQEINEWIKVRRVPLIAHPAAFRERWRIDKDGTRHGPYFASPRAEWEAAGAQIILTEGPHQLGPGCWVTGAIPRRSFEKSGTPPAMAYREDGEFKRDYVDDDQSVVINIKSKGVIIISGCAHSGIINTINYAKEISGIDKIYAILGGFHLAKSSGEEIKLTIEEIKLNQPEMIVPSHCTGFNATSQFAQEMPSQFVLGTVGTTYLF